MYLNLTLTLAPRMITAPSIIRSSLKKDTEVIDDWNSGEDDIAEEAFDDGDQEPIFRDDIVDDEIESAIAVESKQNSALGFILRGKKTKQLKEPVKRELIKQYQDSGFTDRVALDKLVRGDTGLVVWWAYKFRTSKLGTEDLIQSAWPGYIRAVQKFKPKGAQFSTYASLWIKQAIVRHIISQGDSIGLPVYLASEIAKLKREWSKYHHSEQEAITPEFLSEKTGIPVAECEKIRKIVHEQQVDSLDRQWAFGGGEHKGSIGEIIECPKVREYEENYVANADYAGLNLLLNRLGEKKARYIRMRFGLLDGERKSLAYTAWRFKMNEVKAKQFEFETLAELRKLGDKNNFNAEFDGVPIIEADNSPKKKVFRKHSKGA